MSKILVEDTKATLGQLKFYTNIMSNILVQAVQKLLQAS